MIGSLLEEIIKNISFCWTLCEVGVGPVEFDSHERILPPQRVFYNDDPPSNLAIHFATAISFKSSSTPLISVGHASLLCLDFLEYL